MDDAAGLIDDAAIDLTIGGLEGKSAESSDKLMKRPRERFFGWGNTVAAAIKRDVGQVASIFLPDECQLCEALLPSGETSGLCQRCLGEMERISSACLRCGAPVPSVVGDREDCVVCRKGKWPANRIYAWGVYRGRLREAVIALKHPGSEPLGYALGEVMGRWLGGLAESPRFDIVIATPKHWIKRILQHHNSSEFLAERIARHLRIPYRPKTLRRVRPTAKQGTLMRDARASNMKGVFRVNRWSSVLDKRVLIVDDIVTSGATAAEMANVLWKSGAQSVEIACLARGVGK